MCCGCGACEQICPVAAIKMEENDDGFRVPTLNKSKCIACAKCTNVCPILNTRTGERRVRSFVAAYAKDPNVRYKSSSGGIFYLLAKQCIQKGGIVFGVAWDSTLHEARHIKVTDISQLWQIQGSKYVQSNSNYSYLQAEKHLKEGFHVLYSGTPCQIVALKNFLGCQYDNLTTVEVVCHGVPSPGVLKQYLQEVSQENLCHVNFRDKEFGWRNYSLSIFKEEKLFIRESFKKNIYLQSFLSCLILRESCFHCSSKNKLHSDLVIADYWNINQINPNFDDDTGVSAVLSMTEKGQEALNLLEKELNCIKTEMSAFFKANRNIIASSYRHPKRKRFFAAFRRKKALVAQLMKENLHVSLFSKYCRKIRRHFDKKAVSRIGKRLSQGESL